jgi:hypothetical protein
MSTKFFTVGNNGNHGNQVALDCLCTMATKLFTLGNHGKYGNQAVYFRAKNNLNVLLALGRNMYGCLLNHLVDFNEIWYGGDAIQRDLNAIILNPIASTFLKWLRFKFQIFRLAQQWFGIGNQGMYFTKGSHIILNEDK